MTTILDRLLFVKDRAPSSLQGKVARVIDAVANSTYHGVGAPIANEYDKAPSALSELEDNADSFLVLMRTLPKKHPFKKVVSDLAETSSSLMEKLTEAGTELDKILSADEQDMQGVKASALGKLADLIKEESSKISDVQQLSKMLDGLTHKAKKEEKTTPVEHKLPGKEVGKEDNDEDKGIGEEVPGAGDNKAAPELSGSQTAPPSSTPNLSAL